MDEMQQMPQAEVPRDAGKGACVRWRTVCAGLALIILLGMSALAANLFLARSQWTSQPEGMLYIDADDTADSVKVKSGLGWRMTLCSTLLSYHPRTGRYDTRSQNALMLFRRLRNGQQDPIRLTLPSVRTLDRLAQYLSLHLMMSTQEVMACMTDTALCHQLGFSVQELPALFVPNTYEIYWDVTPLAFMNRMKREHDHFWNDERIRKAQACALTPAQVCTLASIVDEETANGPEKPDVAAMYLNRLQLGMPLQADPTVKFAVGDFSLRRIYHEHLKVDSPYNTYLHQGLPPGPIRIASIEGIDAVLNHSEHPYLYMCAKEDFSGTHRFAVTYQEHLRNARLYAQALNERGIR